MGNLQNWLSSYARWWIIIYQSQPNPNMRGDGPACASHLLILFFLRLAAAAAAALHVLNNGLGDVQRQLFQILVLALGGPGRRRGRGRDEPLHGGLPHPLLHPAVQLLGLLRGRRQRRRRLVPHRSSPGRLLLARGPLRRRRGERRLRPLEFAMVCLFLADLELFHLPRLALLSLLLRLVLRPIAIAALPRLSRLLRFLCLSLHLLLLLFQFHPLLLLLLFRALGSVVGRRRSRRPLVAVAHGVVIHSPLAPVSKAPHHSPAHSCPSSNDLPYLLFPLAGVQLAHALPPPLVMIGPRRRPRRRPRPAVAAADIPSAVDCLPPVPVHPPAAPTALLAQGAVGPPAGGPGEAAPATVGQGAAVDEVICGALKGPRALPDAVAPSGRRPFV